MSDKILDYLDAQIEEAQRRFKSNLNRDEYYTGLIRGLKIAQAAILGQVGIWAAGSDEFYER